MIRRVIWLLAFMLQFSSSVTRAQEKERLPRYEFFKENGKPKFIKQHWSIEVHLKDTLPYEGTTSQDHMLGGYLLYKTNDSLAIDLVSEVWQETRWMDRRRWQPVAWKHIRMSLSDTVVVPKVISLGSIDHVDHRSSISGAGTFITVVSAAGLLFYAPLKAMRFRDGTFSSERYLRIAKPCLIGVGVGFVVMPFTDPKRRVRVMLASD